MESIEISSKKAVPRMV